MTMNEAKDEENGSECHVTYIVYRHTCTITGKSYVGYTKRTIERRWMEHVNLSKDSRPGRAKYFQRAIKLYGSENWTHEVLETGFKSLDEACNAEIMWIDRVGSLAPNGYNETAGGHGVHLTEQGREKHRENTRAALARPDVRERYLIGIRASHSTPEFLEKNRQIQKIVQIRPDVVEKKSLAMRSRRAQRDFIDPNEKQVEQISSNGEVLAVFRSATEASRSTGTNYTHLTEVARGLRKRSGGFGWRYVDRKDRR